MNDRIIKKNVFWAVVAQIVSITCGFIIPRLMLTAFGSEANGLVTSINQFLNYVSLLEGGVSGVAVAALYKPLQQKDEQRINLVVNAIQRFFVRLGMICCGFTLVIAFIYPLIVSTEYDTKYIILLTFVLGTRLIIQYTLSITYRLLLRADQKVYYVSAVQAFITIIHLVVLWICIIIKCDILSVYFFSGITYMIQPLFYFVYVKKHYCLRHEKQINKDVLKQKWDGLGQNIAYFIHTNTDIVLLTLFAKLTDVAIYSVYLMVANAVNGMITTVSSAIVPSMGNLLAKGDKEESNRAFDKYEFIILFITFIFYTCALILIMPFVSVYTLGINDADYLQPVFGTLLLFAEMAFCIRDPYLNVAYASGHFKQTAKYAYTEATVNIVLSLVLIHTLGLVGVAIGTLVSMSVRVLQHVYYIKDNILIRKPKVFYQKMLIYIVMMVFIILFGKSIVPQYMDSYIQWIIYAFITAITAILLYTGISLIFFKNQMKAFINSFIHKSHNN